MNLYEKIKNREEKISLVGLGYVGMPIAVAFEGIRQQQIVFDGSVYQRRCLLHVANFAAQFGRIDGLDRRTPIADFPRIRQFQPAPVPCSGCSSAWVTATTSIAWSRSPHRGRDGPWCSAALPWSTTGGRSDIPTATPSTTSRRP